VHAQVLQARSLRFVSFAFAGTRPFGRGDEVGGRRTVRRLHLGRKRAEARLVELGHPLTSRLLPPETAPPQLALDVA
jgi:hypothetical protein